MMLMKKGKMKKGKSVGSKGSPLKKKSGWGGAGGRRKKYIGTRGDGYQ